MREKAIVQGFSSDLEGRNRKGLVWYLVFLSSTIVGILAVIALMLNIINGAFGYVAYEAKVDPDTLAAEGAPMTEQSKEQLVTLLQTTLSSGSLSLSFTDASIPAPILANAAASLGLTLKFDLPVPYSADNPVAREIAQERTADGAGTAWLYVEPDGDVLPAQGMSDRLLGNFLRDPWVQIYRP